MYKPGYSCGHSVNVSIKSFNLLGIGSTPIARNLWMIHLFLILYIGLTASISIYCFNFILDIFYILYFYFDFNFFNKTNIFITYVFIAKLTFSWFFIVWLRMNLLRFRFDQVASFTWHEMVIYAVYLLIQIIVIVWVL